MELADQIKQSLASYAGLEKREPTDLGATLRAAVDAQGQSVLLDEGPLAQLLASQGVDRDEALRVCLLTTVPGYREMVDPERQTKQADLDRFVQNAISRTGLRRSEVMRLTADILLASGAAYNYAAIQDRIVAPYRSGSTPTVSALSRESKEDVSQRQTDQDLTSLDELYDSAYVIPMKQYWEDFAIAYRDWEKQRNQPYAASNMLENARLSTLANAGIPFAKYLIATSIMENAPEGADLSDALRLLHEAAEDDDAQALAALGDYYYEQGPLFWSRAFSYYTGIGALALTDVRQKHVKVIMETKSYNKRMFWQAGILLAAMAALLVLAPGGDIHPPLRVFGTFCLVVSGALLFLSMLHSRIEPYRDYRGVPVAMFAIWACYAAARLLM